MPDRHQNANRGRPLPWTTRAVIDRLSLDGETLRAIAAVLGISKTTAQKYRGRSLVQTPRNVS
jgi:hypothetical protein